MVNEAVTSPSFEDPRKVYIGELLSMNNPSIVVPDWQRSYSWKSEHLDAFWNDLTRFSSAQGEPVTGEYFLGAIVLVRRENGQLLLLDGQQRLATSAILLSTLRDEISRTNEAAANQIQENFLAGFDYNENRRIDKLTLNIYDREFFRRLVLERRVGDYAEPLAEISSQQNILFARQYFERAVEQHLEGSGDRYARTQRLRRVLLRHLCVIQAISSDENSAADVFEVLNDRGIGLSTPDLLRNLVLRRANAGEHDVIVELWRSVLSFGNDNDIKDFLRHFWVSRYGDVKSQSLYREMKATLIDQDIASLAFSERLSDSVDMYQRIRSFDLSNPALNEQLKVLGSLPASSKALLPALLALVETLDEASVVEPARVMIETYIRHTLIAGQDNSSLENVVYRAARALREDANAESFIELVRTLRQDDASVERAFSGLSVTNQKFRRLLLVRLELDRRRTEEIEVGPPDRVHVEHVYPQTPPQDRKWGRHNLFVNRLGNLTLLSGRINKQIQNQAFEDKRERFVESELELTREISLQEEWTEDTIQRRQEELAGRINSIFPA